MSEAASLDTISPFGSYPLGRLARTAWQAADAHRLPDWLRYKVRNLVAKRFPGPFDLEAEGLNFRIYPGVNRDDWKIVAKSRLSERGERRLLARHFTRDTVFVDAGANIGTHTLFASRLCARVIAIEANPDIAAKLSYNVALNGMKNVTVVATAVGSEDATRDMVICPANLNLSTLSDGIAPTLMQADWTTRPVRVRLLSDILDEAGVDRIDVLKLDVEGYEDRALLPHLRSAPRRQWPRVVMIEVDHRPDWKEDCLSEMTGLGYRETGTTGANIVLELLDHPEPGRERAPLAQGHDGRTA